METSFNIDRYKELLKKQENLNRQGSSLFYENEAEGRELSSYNIRVEDQLCYERKKSYYDLISQYLERVITQLEFPAKFTEMVREDTRTAKLITADSKKLASFSVDLKAEQFSSLINEIDDMCIVTYEFPPEECISDEEFRESIKKIFIQMQEFF